MSSNRAAAAVVALIIAIAAAGANARPDEARPAAAWAPRLEAIMDAEIADKALPSFALVLVDRGRVVARVAKGVLAPNGAAVSSATPYRTGSVGKTLTDLAILISSERGLVDLDADVRRYLPDFAPENPSGEPITLRRLILHTSGLVREPPVGSYFDRSGASLAQTVASLNGTTLLWAPGTRTKYSNAGLAVAGRVLEAVHGEPYPTVMQRLVFAPARMTTAAVGRTPAIAATAARGVMRTPEGSDWEAPTFDLGISPAGDLYASIDDMASLMSVLLADDGRLLRSETLHRMWTPDPPRPDWQMEVGLGFSLNGRFDGTHRMARHGGAVYGFATELAILPEDGLGVYAVAARDLANDTAQAVAQWALRAALAARAGQDPPAFDLTPAPYADVPARLAGCTESAEGKDPAIGGTYGEPHNPLWLCWKDGRLHARVEWMFLYPLEGGAGDVWTFPSYALYGHEQLRLVRDGRGGVREAVIGHGRDGVRFPRRPAAVD